jgi:hypothetical protein
MAQIMNDALTEQQKKDKEDREKVINMLLDAVKNNISRLDQIKDPMTRHILFLEKLLTITDVLVGMTTTHTVDLSGDLKIKIANVMVVFNQHTCSLLEWIQSPAYSPDHPVGNMMMKGCEKDFDDRK